MFHLVLMSSGMLERPHAAVWPTKYLRFSVPRRLPLLAVRRHRNSCNANHMHAHPTASPALLQCAGFMVLAIYFDAVLPDANGVHRPPWFFLLPGYWRRSGVSDAEDLLAIEEALHALGCVASKRVKHCAA